MYVVDQGTIDVNCIIGVPILKHASITFSEEGIMVGKCNDKLKNDEVFKDEIKDSSPIKRS